MNASPVPASQWWTGAVIIGSLIFYRVMRRRGLGPAAGWIALALAGQACVLQLLFVGSEIRVQTFYGWSVLLTSYRGAFLLAVLLQAALVVWGMRRFRPDIFSRVRRVLTWKQLLLWVVLFSYAAITVEPKVARELLSVDFAEKVYIGTRQISKQVFGLFIFAVSAMTLFLATVSVDSSGWERLRRWWQGLDRRRLAWVCALWVVGVSSLLNVFVLDRMPHVPDEGIYLFQAKYIAAGHWYLPAPPEPEAFKCGFQIIEDNKWYGIFPPGWPLVLAAGISAGVPWLVNPLLGGLSLLLTHLLLRRLYDRTIADVVVLLLAFSPWLLFLSASYMSHQLSLVFLLLGLLAVERAKETGSVAWGAVAGFSFGALLHVRMLEAVLLVSVAGLWWLGAGWRKLRVWSLGTALIVGLGMTGLLLTYNNMLTGNPWELPINKYMDQAYYVGANRLGFGPDVGNLGWVGVDALPGHGFIDVLMNANHNLYMVNFELFGWACGSLLFVVWLLGQRRVRRDLLMWGLLIAVGGGMSLYWFSGGPDFGARYWYPMILPLAVLTARGCQNLIRHFRNHGVSAEDSQRIWLFVALASLLGFVNLMPWRSLDKYHYYRGIRPDIRHLERAYDFGDSLVLIRGKPWPDYAAACVFNPTSVSGDAPGPIYVRDAGPEVSKRLRRYYSHRLTWVVAGPGETGDGFQVLEGPIPPGNMR